MKYRFLRVIPPSITSFNLGRFSRRTKRRNTSKVKRRRKMHLSALNRLEALMKLIRHQTVVKDQQIEGYRVQSAGLRVQGSAFSVQSSAFSVRRSAFSVNGFSFMVYSSLHFAPIPDPHT
jgi:hypothetical protein